MTSRQRSRVSPALSTPPGAVAARAGALLLLMIASGCGRSEAPTAPAASRRAETGEGRTSTNVKQVTLTAEAIRQAGITTEVVHLAPFAVTLSVPARLSPTPETPEELEAQLVYQSAEARFRRTTTELERVRKLSAQDVVAPKAVQAAEAEFAQARVERLRAEAALRSLGIDISRESAYPKSDLWALADIYDPQVPQVKAGARAWIRVEAFPAEMFPGRVIALAAFLKPQTRTLTVRIAVQDPQHRLRPQEPATADIQVSERIALNVPGPAVLYDGIERAVFVRRGDSFEKLKVTVGAEQAGRVEVVAGIADGDEVVIQGAQLLLGELNRAQIPLEQEGEEGERENGEGP